MAKGLKIVNIKDKRSFYVNYLLPDLCALCANYKPTMTWTIDQKEHDSKTRFELAEGFIETNTHRDLSFTLGVCNACYSVLKKHQAKRHKVSTIIKIVFVLLGIGSLLAILLIEARRPVVLGLLFLTLYFAWKSRYFLLPLMVSLVIPEKPIARRYYDGKKFTFRNKKYEDAFRELNPNLVIRK